MNLRFQPAGWIPQRTQLGCWRVGGWGEAWRRRPQYQRQEWGIGRGPRGSWANSVDSTWLNTEKRWGFRTPQKRGGFDFSKNPRDSKIRARSVIRRSGHEVFRKRARNYRYPSNWMVIWLKFVCWWVFATFPESSRIISCSFSLQPAAFPLIQCWKANNMFHRHVSKYQHSSINIYQHYLFPFINIYQPLSTFINIHPPFSKTTLIMEVS